jgi:DNA helicase HerA-like ATPase
MAKPLVDAAGRSVGSVESVAPQQITVLLDIEAPHGTAFGVGDPVRFPRINGFVLLPNEIGALVGVVTWLGIERAPFPKRAGLKDFGLVDLPFPQRRLTLNPVGTLVARTVDEIESFELMRGAASFPTVGDPVVLPTADQLRALVEAQDKDARVFIGSSPLAGDARVQVDPDKLFGRHLAILGNTGSGKSCSVAGLIRWSIDAARETRMDAERDPTPNARFVVLDPNGEYSKTFADIENVRRFQAGGGDGTQALNVPAWIWDSREWSAFTQATAATQRPLLLQALRDLRGGKQVGMSPEVRLVVRASGHLSVLQAIISTGVAGFGDDWRTVSRCGNALRNMTSDLEGMVADCPAHSEQIEAVASAATQVADARRYPKKAGGEGFNPFTAEELEDVRGKLEELIEALPEIDTLGGPSEDAPLPFEASDLVEHIEILAQLEDFSAAAQYIDTMLLRIRSMLADARLSPIVAPDDEITFQGWLEGFLGDENAASGQIAVVDLSLVPPDVLVLTVAVIGRVVFEALQRYRRLSEKELPTVLVLEEAHTFVKRPPKDEPGFANPSRMCRETFERIAREGRKFGLGLVLSSQRPSELSATALAQCNTFLLHRLVNDRDQDLVGRLVPDNLAGLLRELPSLPSQQAVLLGWATQIPLLVKMRTLPDAQRPQSADPAFWDVWVGDQERPLDWSEVVADWTAGN